jgi:hypothetical protein
MSTITVPRLKRYSTLTGWRDFAFPPDDDPEPPPPDDDPGGWATAFATRDFPSIDGVIQGELVDWYVGYVGHDPGLTYQDVSGNLAISDSWLASNLGNGRVSYGVDAQDPWGRTEERWLVERYRTTTGNIRVSANNVTVRNCFADIAVTSIFYAAQAVSGSNPSNLLFDHVTFAGNQMETSGASINFPQATEPNQIRFWGCDFSGHRAGIYCFGGVTAEYCYVHDLIYAPESHNTGASMRARNNTLRRNLIVDGNSSAVSMYAENSPYTGILVTENALRLNELDTGAEILLGKTYEVPQPGETREVIGNLFYRGNFSSGALAYTTTLSGNIDINGDPVPA